MLLTDADGHPCSAGRLGRPKAKPRGPKLTREQLQAQLQAAVLNTGGKLVTEASS
jgi:hypothetical protein